MDYGARICPYCEGTGQETVRTGHLVARRDCSYCNGEKLIIRFKCIECHGIGRKIYEVPFRSDIPPGMANGQVLRFEVKPTLFGMPVEREEEREGHKKRYLYVTMQVEESAVFSKKGLDLVSNLELSPGLALLGGRLTIQGIKSSYYLVHKKIKFSR
jgi:molecular chaperone DnaJ